MAYTVPNCDEIGFTFGGSYFTPYCASIDFSFGIGVDLEMVAINSEIIIQSEDLNFYSGEMMLPKNSEIQIESKKSILDILIPIGADDSEINIFSGTGTVEILPDMIMQNSSIVLSSETSQMRSTESFHLPSKTSPSGEAIGWGKLELLDNVKKFSHGIGDEIDIQNRDSNKTPILVDNSTGSKWITLHYFDNGVKIPIYVFDKPDHTTGSGFIGKMDYFDHHIQVPFGSNHIEVDWTFNVPYLEPGAKDVLKKAVYDEPGKEDWHIGIHWGAPGPKDATKKIAWGPFSYFTLCSNLDYHAPDPCSIKFSFPNKYPLVSGVCSGIVFNVNEYATDIRCPYDHYHSGVRDSGLGLIPSDEIKLTYPQAREMYYMFNSVMVEEVVTSTPIEVLHVDAKIDRNSWLWSFNITVAAKCYLDLIKPIDGVMGHIKITLNGYEWYCTVEGWSENRSFGSQAWTITGRSPAMMFGDPVGQKSSGIIDIAKQGQTIIEEMVQAKQLPPNWPIDFQGWTADFSFYNTTGNVVTGFKPYLNWYIPENTVNYVEKTDIDVIKELVSSIGSYVQTEPNENKLTVRPLYAHQPWDWKDDNENINWITMNESQMVEMGRSNKLNPYYQAVHVVGESIGGSESGGGSDGTNTAIHVEVRRSEFGPSTAEYAPMVTSPYITSSKAGLENGRMIIANTGEWLIHTLRIGVLCPEGGSSFQLFKTGDMISVLENNSAWYGQVIGVTIVAASAGAGFAIEQVIEVEEYRGD